MNRKKRYILVKTEVKGSDGENTDNKEAKIDAVWFNSRSNVFSHSGVGGGGYRMSNDKGPVSKLHTAQWVETTGHT